jgi:hypothetical protein
MGTHAVASYRDKLVIKLLYDFNSLLCTDSSHQRLAEIVGVGVTQKAAEVITNLIYNQVDAVNWCLL